MADQAEIPTEAGDKASPWNSLELAKVLMAAATPLAIFILGVRVTQSAEAERTKRESEARIELRAQERTSRREAVRLASVAREEARRDARLARDEAFIRERALREEGYQREALMRRESDASEVRLRRETAVEARRNRLLDKRIELWARAASDAASAHELVTQILEANQSEQNVELLLEDLVARLGAFDSALAPYDGFFSPSFNLTRRRYRIALTGFITAVRARASGLEDAHQSVEIAYRDFMAIVRTDLTDTQSAIGD